LARSTDPTLWERRFCYVDVHWQKPKKDGTLTYTKWKRVPVGEVDQRCRAPANNYNCFATVLRYALPRHEDGEEAWGPFYLDLDAADESEEKGRRAALADARKIVRWFCDAGLDKTQVRVWFSGNRGFHITIDPYALGAEPSPDLHSVYKLFGGWLVELLDLKTLDLAVYSSRRMWRLPDSIHHKSGLFKVEVTHEELKRGMAAILKQAKQPRGPLYDDTDIAALAERDPHPELSQLYASFVQDWEHHKDLQRLRPRKPIEVGSEMPVCIKWLLGRKRLPRPHTGHLAMLCLASWFKDAGKTQEECLAAMLPWALAREDSTDRGKPRVIEADVRAQVRSIYAGEDYHFACAFIRSLSAPDDRVACEYRNCPVAREKDQVPAQPIELHLSEASRACYQGLPIKTQVVVSGKDAAPYLVPRKIEVTCQPNNDPRSRCASCPLAPFHGAYSYTIPPDEPILLEFVGISAKAKWRLLRSLTRVPQNCTSAVIRETESYNIEDVRLVPPVCSYPVPQQGHYVVRRAFYVGHALKTNRPYEIVARTLPDPKSQYAVHLFHKVKAIEDDLSTFKVTPDLHRNLRIFQPARDQDLWEKFEEIHADLEANCYRIWNRRLAAMAMDLAWHSVLHFNFHGERVRRGWLEVFILGDSGQGKTHLARRLLEWYHAGDFLSGEDAGRTGLTYSLQQTERRWFLAWGIIPLNDGRLLVIDEFSDFPRDEFAKMSSLRSSGILRVHRVISDATLARCRLIYLSNPAKASRSLGSYAYGIEALEEIIPRPEDIRRLDIALAVKSGEVPPEVINRWELPQVPNRYTSELCHQLVLWAWSRQPDDVHWTDEATRECLKEAEALAAEYWPEPPLVEPADQRIKLARIATAAAARTYSSPDGRQLAVEPRHVKFAAQFLRECFATPGLRYDAASQIKRQSSEMTPEKLRALEERWRQLPAWRRLPLRLLALRIFSRTDLEDQVGLSPDQARRIIRFLSVRGLIRKTSRGYVKEPCLIEFLNGLVESGEASEEGDFGDLPF